MKEKALANLRKFLPEHTVLHCETEEVSTHDGLMYVAGIAVELSNGLQIFGSSSASDETCLLLASYEVLERFALLTSNSDVEVPKNKFKYSISNGVALHTDEETAKSSAFLELLERNEILKSWYLNTPIKIVSSEAQYQGPTSLHGYDIMAYDFSTIPGHHVIGVFAFPHDRNKAAMYGFGAGFNLADASKKAGKEFWTRMGFVGDEVTDSDPDFSCTPDYHQDFYLNPKNTKYLIEWLTSPDKKPSDRYMMKGISFTSLKPLDWKELKVFKASSEDCIRLFFGDASGADFDFVHRCDIPHPII